MQDTYLEESEYEFRKKERDVGLTMKECHTFFI